MAEAQLSSLKIATATLDLTQSLEAWTQDGSNPFTVDKEVSSTPKKLRFQGPVANNASVNGWMMIRFRVPTSYTSGDFTLTATAATSPTVNTSSTLDVVAFEMDSDGTEGGSDLYAGAALDINSATFAEKAYTIDGSGLAAGDDVIVVLHAATNDTGGTSNGYAYVSKVVVSCSAYGGVWA